MSQAAFFSGQPKGIERVYGGGRKELLQAELDFYPTIVSTENFNDLAPDLANWVIFNWKTLEITYRNRYLKEGENYGNTKAVRPHLGFSR